MRARHTPAKRGMHKVSRIVELRSMGPGAAMMNIVGGGRKLA